MLFTSSLVSSIFPLFFCFLPLIAAAVQQAFQTMEPCTIVTYLFTLGHAISVTFENLRVVGREKNLAEARLLLYWSAKTTLGNGLRILGLKPLERM